MWKTRRQIEEVLPEGFMMTANCLKAGLGLQQAFQIVSQEGPFPLNNEFQRILEKVKLGASLEEALLASESRIRLPDFSLMVHSIILLRQIGGNFVTHFENLARILRERKKVSSKIRLLTAQGMTQGAILGLFPWCLLLAFYFLSPDFIAPLWETTLGWLALGAIFILDLGGFFWMKYLARIEI